MAWHVASRSPRLPTRGSRVIECTDLALLSPSHREVSHCHLRPSRGGRGDPHRREEEGREGRERQVRRRARIARRVPQARRAPGRRDAQIVTRRHAVRGARRAARGARRAGCSYSRSRSRSSPPRRLPMLHGTDRPTARRSRRFARATTGAFVAMCVAENWVAPRSGGEFYLI